MPPLTVRALGEPEVRIDGVPLPPLRTRKELALLVLLALEDGRPVERARVAGALWPDAARERALHNLRRSLMLLRDALGAQALRLEATTARTVRLNLDGAEVDALDFDRRIAAGDHAGAVALYRGPLMDGSLDDWAIEPRQRRHEAYVAARTALALAAEPHDALVHWRALTRAEPLHEAAWRGWIDALARSGSRAEALAVFRQWRDYLAREHALRPEPETLALYDAIRQEARRRTPAPAPTPAPALAPERKWSAPAGHGLPHAPTPFVGRRAERERLAETVLAERLVTLLGMGGIGKTRLALQIAGALDGELAEGAVFVDLTGCASPAALAPTIARAFGLDAETPDALAAALAERRLLLVLDNAELVRDACREAAAALRARCPHLRLLVTSREPLELAGEVLWRVAPLAEDDAVALFTQRARAARPDRTPDPDAVRALCRQLEGIPLALELAAARLTVLTLEQLAARLDTRFALLAGGRALPERHRSLQGVLESSWELLDPDERATLSALSVCRGGWTLEIARAVAGLDDDLAALDRLTSLAARSLVLADEGRFRMLETVRLFAGERLAPEARDAAEGRLLDALLERAESEPPGTERWFDRMEAERGNLRVAVDLALRRPERRADGLRLLRTTGALFRLRGGKAQARQDIERLLEALPPETDGYAQGEWLAGKLAQLLGEVDAADRHYARSLDHSRSAADRALALGELGRLARDRGDLVRADDALAEAAALAKSAGQEARWAVTLVVWACVARMRGDYALARSRVLEAMEVSRRRGGALGRSADLLVLANIARCEGEADEERACLDESLALAREVGYLDGQAEALVGRAVMVLRGGDVPAALADLDAAEALFRSAESAYGLAAIGLVRAEALRTRERWDEAAAALRDALGYYAARGIVEETLLCLLEAGWLRDARGDRDGAAALLGAAEAQRRRSGLALEPTLRARSAGLAPNGLAWDDAVARALEALSR